LPQSGIKQLFTSTSNYGTLVKKPFSHKDHGELKEKSECFQYAFLRAFVPSCEKLYFYESLNYDNINKQLILSDSLDIKKPPPKMEEAFYGNRQRL